MIIESSKVGMASSRSYFHYENHERASIEVKGGRDAINVFISDESKSKLAQIQEAEAKIKEQEKEEEKRRKENAAKNAIDLLARMREENEKAQELEPPEEEATVTLLRRMLALLNGKEDPGAIKHLSKQLKNTGNEFKISTGQQIDLSTVSTHSINVNKGLMSSGSMWTRATAQSSFVSESEVTTFSSTGYAKTADGREINFNVAVEMSRSFEATMDSISYESIFKDPLVINVDSAVASVSDMKFRFDIDADGQEDEVSMASGSSRFLALDKNGDGKINDGSELFGAKTGDGFGELAEYDEDGNGWIDEADSVFSKLVLWTKDSEGNDIKMSLKDADVGAIYLDSADTQFSLNNMSNNTNAMIRRTGLYLKESGGVGTVQHVDLAL